MGDCARYLECTEGHRGTHHAPLFTALIMDQGDMLRLLMEEGGVDPAQMQPEWIQVGSPTLHSCQQRARAVCDPATMSARTLVRSQAASCIFHKSGSLCMLHLMPPCL